MMTFDESEVGQLIYTMLKNVSTSIYHNRAERGSSFPYAVFNLLDAFQQEGTKTNFMLEIDIWDNKGNDITDLVALQKSLQEYLHKRTCINLSFNLESTLNLDATQEEQLRRRQLRFSATYYNRN